MPFARPIGMYRQMEKPFDKQAYLTKFVFLIELTPALLTFEEMETLGTRSSWRLFGTLSWVTCFLTAAFYS